jgi:type III secretion protein U
MSSEEKSESPTQQKIKKARKDGQVAKSKELTTAVTFLAVFGLIWFGADFFTKHLRRVLDASLELVQMRHMEQKWEVVFTEMLLSAAWIVLPAMVVAAITAVLVGLLQTKGVFSIEPLKMKFEKLNPGESIKNLFSTKQLGVLIQLLFKLALIVAVLTLTVKYFLNYFVIGIYGKLNDASHTGMVALKYLLGGVALVLISLALLDYLQQYFEYIKQNRMTKTERKREQKDNTGDPDVNAQKREFRRELLESSIKPTMASANVVITNPTHYAVALYYESGVVDLPVLMAKGMDSAALEIRRDAGQKLIPILENPPLARALFASVELGQYVGDDHLEAVAEVFRWLNNLKSTH